jgi:hypothetical protein
VTTSSAPVADRVESGFRFPWLIAVCAGLIALGIIPILFSCDPLPTINFFSRFTALQWLGRAILVALVFLIIATIARIDSAPGPEKVRRYSGFALLAAFLTFYHYFNVDLAHLAWQIEQYNGVLRHTYVAPDQYRFLPQGILWWMLLGNADFVFSYVVYRFLFTFLLCQAIYQFARLYLTPCESVFVVLLYAVFYPLSTRYYYGNMLDPMSHAVMLAALTCCYRRQFAQFSWLIVLGMLIKETMLVIIPCYYLMNSKTMRLRDARVAGRLAVITVIALAVFLACRIPFNFHYDFKTLNRTSELMIYSNLGFSGAKHWSSVPVYQRYLHPILFIFIWLPLIIWKRRLLPAPLFRTALYLAAAFYLTNLCFSWNHESRNFVPPLIVLLVCTLLIVNRSTASFRMQPEANRGNGDVTRPE